MDFRGRWFSRRVARGVERGCARLSFLMNSFTRLCAGLERFFIKANVLFCVPKENQKWFSRW